MVAEANAARPTTMRLLDKVPIRRVSDRAGQGGHSSDIETSNTKTLSEYSHNLIHSL